MTDRLDESGPMIPRDGEFGQHNDDERQGFWADGPDADLSDEEPDTNSDSAGSERHEDVPSWVREDVIDEVSRRVDSEESKEESIPSWLRLSRTVDAHAVVSEPTRAMDYASLYPKAQGGRPVMRGPVEGIAPDEWSAWGGELEEPYFLDADGRMTDEKPSVEEHVLPNRSTGFEASLGQAEVDPMPGAGASPTPEYDADAEDVDESSFGPDGIYGVSDSDSPSDALVAGYPAETSEFPSADQGMESESNVGLEPNTGLEPDSELGPDVELEPKRGRGARRRWRLFGRRKRGSALENVWQDVEYEPVLDGGPSPMPIAEPPAYAEDPSADQNPHDEVYVAQGLDDTLDEYDLVPVPEDYVEDDLYEDEARPLEPIAEYQSEAGYGPDDDVQSSVAPLSDEALRSLMEGQQGRESWEGQREQEGAGYAVEHLGVPEVSGVASGELPLIEPEPLSELDELPEPELSYDDVPADDAEGGIMAEPLDDAVLDLEFDATPDAEPAQDAPNDAEVAQDEEGDKEGLLERVTYGTKLVRPSWKAVVIVVAVIIALLAVYLVGVSRVSGVFPPNTGIGECDVSGMTLQEAEEALTAQTEGYSLTITVGNFAVIIDGASVSADRDEPRIAQEAFERQSPFLWPISYLFHYDPGVDQGITYDNVKFDKRINDAIDEFNKKTLPATKAEVDYDSTTQLYSLSGSVEGQAVDKETVLNDAHEAISTMTSSIRPSEKTALRQAEVWDLPQFAQAVNNANTVRGTTIPVLVQGKQVVVCDPLLIRSWVSVSNTPEVVVDTIALQKWADTTLSPLVYSRGEWGEVFLDIDAFVPMFAERLKNGEPGPVEVVTYDELNREGTSRQEAYENSPWNKELGRYIDVDLTAQFARLFDNQGNVLWESAFVSGDMYAGHQTITGTYNLYAHEPGQVLVGLDYNKDGKPDYESYVNFWMPFYGGYGLHDATWRDSFGGDLYLYNGSHGCINLPYDKAEELYNMTAIGDTVYVHE